VCSVFVAVAASVAAVTATLRTAAVVAVVGRPDCQLPRWPSVALGTQRPAPVCLSVSLEQSG
jgi:hypothetical protein